jgi:hypothetical protein
VDSGAISGARERSAPEELARAAAPSGDTYASARRLSGSSSRAWSATESPASAGDAEASLAVSITARTPVREPITRNPPTWALATPRSSTWTSNPRYSSVEGWPAAMLAA